MINADVKMRSVYRIESVERWFVDCERDGRLHLDLQRTGHAGESKFRVSKPTVVVGSWTLVLCLTSYPHHV